MSSAVDLKKAEHWLEIFLSEVKDTRWEFVMQKRLLCKSFRHIDRAGANA
jgi:hypothetical protein